MKTTIKILSFVMICTLLSISVFSTEIATSDVYTHREDNLEITVQRGNLTDEQLHALAISLAEYVKGEESVQIQPRNVLCSMFGHKYETMEGEVVTHLLYSTSPKCLLQTYDISVCTRCDDTVYDVTHNQRIGCCE